jgi:hypothetical protein
MSVFLNATFNDATIGHNIASDPSCDPIPLWPTSAAEAKAALQ